jgi:hypothetical protein
MYVGFVRPDAISLLPLLGAPPTLLVPALAAIVPGIVVLLIAPRNPQGFAAGLALILLTVFIFSILAFVNYYFLAAELLCIALI